MKQFFFILLSLSTFSGAIAVPKVTILKDKLSDYQGQITRLEGELNQIDKDLQQFNSRFLNDQGQIGAMEESLRDKRLKLEGTAEKISLKFNQAKKAYLFYLIESSDTQSVDQDVQKKLLMAVLKSKVESFKKAQSRSKEILKNINNLEQKITSKKHTEDQTYRQIIDLENRKKMIGKNYISLVEQKDVLQNELDILVAKQRAVKKVRLTTQENSFGLPLKTYKSIKKGSKGLTIKFKGTQPIHAPAAGKVIYVGELASYGQVIMVDHGGDIKSVLLGEISIKIKKGQSVKNKQILGYTVSENEMAKALYFEVRKNNKAEDTAKWIAPSYRNKLI